MDIQSILLNPHFVRLRFILERENVSLSEFEHDLQETLVPMLEEHKHDNAVLKEEAYHYILPAIAVYRTLRHYSPDAAIDLFREMWIYGAELGAERLREKAEDSEFLNAWIMNVTPKNCDAGAFVFEIIRQTQTETEYHVKSCPYVRLCAYYGCPEIVTVFCDCDDIAFGHIHPRLIWGRTETIGRGDMVCNFKYTLLPE